MRREWEKMADMGFRTCPETFGWPRSAAHAWGAAPAVYLPTRVLGIRPLEAGFRTFCVDPCAGDLEWARGSVATPYGPIHASWKRNAKGELEITCHAPPECRRVDFI
jgi:alpha-L-rhamnosidase